MLRPINKLSSESFVGVAALLLWTKSEHGKLCASVASTSEENEKENGKRTYIDYEIAKNGKRIRFCQRIVVDCCCCYGLLLLPVHDLNRGK